LSRLTNLNVIIHINKSRLSFIVTTKNLALLNLSFERLGHILEIMENQLDKITSNLVSNSSPMTNTDKVGLIFTIIFFSIILVPIALSESDPYHLKWILEEVKNIIPSIENSFVDHRDTQYSVIIHLKSSSESLLDTTEKIILGKYRAIIN